MNSILDLFLHLDVHLNQWVGELGPWIYVLLFVILFCETGLVVTPFLPGDSLLFAIGSLCSIENAELELTKVITVMMIAVILGDNTNYWIGRKIGPKIFHSEKNRWLNRNHLISTQNFYNRHGGKTIILARFLPIIRTFAPFVAGIGFMNYGRFLLFSICGGLFWIISLVLAGFYFGNIPVVKENFEVVILLIIFISILPLIIRGMLQYKKSV